MARSASRRRLPASVRAASCRDEERRVAAGLALFFAALAVIDVLIMTLVDEFVLPGVLLLVYLASLIVMLLFVLWRRRGQVTGRRRESTAAEASRPTSI
jgi:hypothetical protein